MSLSYTKIILPFIILTLLIAGFPNYSAKVDVVPHGGNDGRDDGHGRTRGTIIVNQTGSGDYTHIQWAVDNASEGDTVYVEAGVYHERINVRTSINLEGEAASRTVIGGGGSGDVVVVNADRCTISDMTIRNGGHGYDPDYRSSLKINSSNNTVKNCVLTGSNIGIGTTPTATHNRISNNECNDNYATGIRIFGENRTGVGEHVYWILNNTCNSNGGCGICVWGGRDSKISNNTCFYNRDGGIYLTNRTVNTVINKNKCSWNRRYPYYPGGIGIILKESDNNSIGENICNNNGGYGILLSHNKCDQIYDNICNNNTYGISIGIRYDISEDESELRPVNIDRNICNMNKDSGIVIAWKMFSIKSYVISNNSCNYNNETGIICWENNTIINNTCLSNLGSGISCSKNNLLLGNTCNNNHEFGLDISGSNNVLDSNNLQNNSEDGIRINKYSWDVGENNTIINNTCDSNNVNGISLNSCRNIIINNTCINHTHGSGIYLTSSDENKLNSNDCRNNSQGILLNDADYNDFEMNNIESNTDYGIFVSGDSNEFLNNTIRSNGYRGMGVPAGSAENHIFGNLFIDNYPSGKQASDSGTDNIWYRGNSGNYWSDLTSPDMNIDGIVDKPYVLAGSANATDPYPLTNPLGVPVPLALLGNDFLVDQLVPITLDSSMCIGRELIVNYTWDITLGNDTEFLYGPSPTHVFEIPGIYVLKLTVYGVHGLWTNDSILVYVADALPPVISYRDNITIEQHEIVYFNATDSRDNIAIGSFEWSFFYDGEEVMLTGPVVEFTFHSAGVYEITLAVTDHIGNAAVDLFTITVLDITPPVAHIGENMTIDQDATVTLNGSLCSDNVGIVRYEWTLSCGELTITLAGPAPQYNFTIPGNYTVALAVYDAVNLTDTDFLWIYVIDTEDPVARAGEDMTVNVSHLVNFDGSGSTDNVGVVNFTWTFVYDGMNVRLYGPTLGFVFDMLGNYTVGLKVIDAQGNWDVDFLNITVIPANDSVSDDDPDNGSGSGGNGVPPVDDDDIPDGNGTVEEKADRSVVIWMGIIIGAFLLCCGFMFVKFMHDNRKRDMRDMDAGNDGDEHGRTVPGGDEAEVGGKGATKDEVEDDDGDGVSGDEMEEMGREGDERP